MWNVRILQGRPGLQQGGRFRASKAAQSRRGKANVGFPPDPLLLLLELVERLQAGAALVAQGCSEFPLTRKQPIAKSPHGLLCDLSGSRTGLEVRVRKVAC